MARRRRGAARRTASRREPTSTASARRAPVRTAGVRPGAVIIVAAIVVLAVAVAWAMLTLLDLRQDDGAAGLIALLGVPALAAAAVLQVVVGRGAIESATVPRAVWWWTAGVLPAGVLAAAAVAVVRDPGYFRADDPWTPVLLVVCVSLSLLVGALVWVFVLWPVTALIVRVPDVVRSQARASSLVTPVVLLLIGAIGLVGGLSVDYEGIGRRAWGAVVLSILGIPGAYDVRWPPGVWIVRAIVLAVLMLIVVGGRRMRRTSR